MSTMSRLEKLEAMILADDFEARVRALRDEAIKYDDPEQLAACNRALEDISTGNPSCLDCADVLDHAAVQS